MKRLFEQTDLAARLAAYCTRTVRNAGYSAYRSIRLRQDRLISLSSLPNELEQLAVDPQDVPAHFQVGQCDILTPDDELSSALRALPTLRLEIVLRIYYLRQTERETAIAMGMSRDNVHYHKRQALKQLRQKMGSDKE